MTSLINSTPSLSDINEFQHVLGVAFGLNHMFEITPDCITQTYVNETSKTGSDKVHSIFFLKAPINTSKTALIYAATINLYDKERVKKIFMDTYFNRSKNCLPKS